MKDWAFLLAALVAVAAVSLLVVTFIEQAQSRDKAECALKGGVIVLGHKSKLCIDSSVVKP